MANRTPYKFFWIPIFYGQSNAIALFAIANCDALTKVSVSRKQKKSIKSKNWGSKIKFVLFICQKKTLTVGIMIILRPTNEHI